MEYIVQNTIPTFCVISAARLTEVVNDTGLSSKHMRL